VMSHGLRLFLNGSPPLAQQETIGKAK